MQDFFKYLNIAGAVLPLVQSIVQLVEIFPNLTGSQKKEYALNMLETVFNGIKDNPDIKIKELKDIDFGAFKSFLSLLIDTVVGIFNATGAFTKGS